MSNDEKILEMLASLTNAVNGLAKDNQEIKKRLGKLEAGQEDIQRKLNRVESVQRAHSEYLFSMFNSIRELDDRFIQRTANIQDLNLENADDIIMIRRDIDNIKYRIEQLEKAQ